MMLILLVAFIITSSITTLAQTSSTIIIQVTSTSDGPADASVCYPTSLPDECTLRSAWEACNDHSSNDTQCIIELPEDELIYLDVITYGSLIVSTSANIQIDGNEAHVANAAYANINPNSQQVLDKYIDLKEYHTKDRVDANDSIIMRHVKSSTFHTAASSSQFITFVGVDNSASGPTLNVLNFTVSQFGDSNAYGGVISLAGSINFFAESMFVWNNFGYSGGGFYVSYNSLEFIVINCIFDYSHPR